METILTSPTQEVRMGPDHPFVIIGERINPTGRKKLAAEMGAGDYERVKSDALAQVAAGAHMLDVNAGIPMVDEPAILADVVKLVQDLVEVPLCIDSSIVAALESGLSAYKGKALVNSVTGEQERLEAVLPLVAEHKAAVIGITNDESGISHDPDVRFAVAKKIVEAADSYGIPRNDVIIDPLAMPVGAVNTAGLNLFTITRRVRDELGCNTVCGASNISFGLPDREGLNTAFIAMAIAAGMTSAITNPLVESVRKTVLAGDVFMGLDENCMAWLKYSRAAKKAAEGGEGERRRSRRSAAG